MRLKTFMVADHAETVRGKLYVTGGCWDTLSVGQIPVQHPHMTVAIALGVPWQQTNQSHQFKLSLVDEDHQPIIPALEGDFEAGRPAGMRADDETQMLMALNLNGLTIPAEGAYSFVLEIDGSELGRARFKVVAQTPQPATA